jgi:hypothetical protein
MNMLKKFVSGLGAQNAPFGFAPEDPNASYKAGLSYIGDIGANLMANNQGGVDPFANLGTSIQQAKQSGTQRNKEAYTAQRLMEEAAAKKAEREQAAQRQAMIDEQIAQLPPELQGLAKIAPEKVFGAQIDQMFGSPEQPKLYSVGGALVDANGNVVYQGGSDVSQTDRYKVVGNRLFDVLEQTFVDNGDMGMGDLPKGYRPRADGSDGIEPIPGYTPPNAPKPYTPGNSDRNAIRAAREENAILEQTLVTLEEATSLTGKANSGYLSAGRAVVAENLPDSIVPDRIFGSPAQGEATLRLKQIMDAEALASMGKLLKGPTSDRDVKIMLETVNDPNASPKRKQDSIDQVRRLVKAQIAANEDAIEFSLKGPDAARAGSSNGGIPDGITPQEWNEMTDEERAEWQ